MEKNKSSGEITRSLLSLAEYIFIHAVHYREELLLVAVAGKLVYIRKKTRRNSICIAPAGSAVVAHTQTHTERLQLDRSVIPQVDRSLDRMMIYTGKTHTARKMEKEKKRNSEKHVKMRRRKTVYMYIKELDHYIFHGYYTHALWEYIKDCLVPSFIIHAIHLPL
jgi:hypothetical protein